MGYDPNAYPPQRPGQPGSYEPTQFAGPAQPGNGPGNDPYSQYGGPGGRNPYQIDNPYQTPPPPGYNPYAPPQGPGPQQYPGQPGPGYQIPQPPPQQPQPRPGRGRRLFLVFLVLVLIVVGVVVAVAIPAHNRQVADDATATALVPTQQAQASATAQVQAQATQSFYATATAVTTTYPFSANVQLNDPLSDNTGQGGWDTGNGCTFTGGAYHVVEAKANTYNPCMATKTNFSNFTYEVTSNLLNGEALGLVYRADVNSGRSYKFVVGFDGSAAVFVYKDYGTGKELLSVGVDGTSWHAGQNNQVSVVARGSSFTFYVNRQSIGKVTDTTYTSGSIGVVVYNNDKTGEAVFSNAKVWAL